jgi:hypothetical protein
MSCISPCAPTALTAPGSNVDSCWITAATSAGSTPAAPAFVVKRSVNWMGKRICQTASGSESPVSVTYSG